MEKYELKENNTYYYKHHLYVVINIGRQKMENGVWEGCVIYKREDAPKDPFEQKMFVRAIYDFLKNFETLEYVRPSLYTGNIVANGITFNAK